MLLGVSFSECFQVPRRFWAFSCLVRVPAGTCVCVAAWLARPGRWHNGPGRNTDITRPADQNGLGGPFIFEWRFVFNHELQIVTTDIVVPGSVANLGGGFDTLAVAVQLYLRARIVDVRADGGARLVVVNSRPAVSGENAVERAFAEIARHATGPVPTVLVDVESDIPMAAGLGSSAAALIAGLRVFEEVTGPVPETTLLAVATSIEGHADNAA